MPVKSFSLYCCKFLAFFAFFMMAFRIEKTIDESFLFQLIKFETGKEKPKFDTLDPQKNPALQISVVQKLSQKFGVDFEALDMSETFKTVQSNLKYLHQRYQNSKISGRKEKKFFESFENSEPKVFSFVFKEIRSLQDHLEDQVKSLNSQNAQLRQKVSDLRQALF